MEPDKETENSSDEIRDSSAQANERTIEIEESGDSFGHSDEENKFAVSNKKPKRPVSPSLKFVAKGVASLSAVAVVGALAALIGELLNHMYGKNNQENLSSDSFAICVTAIAIAGLINGAIFVAPLAVCGSSQDQQPLKRPQKIGLAFSIVLEVLSIIMAVTTISEALTNETKSTGTKVVIGLGAFAAGAAVITALGLFKAFSKQEKPADARIRDIESNGYEGKESDPLFSPPAPSS